MTDTGDGIDLTPREAATLVNALIAQSELPGFRALADHVRQAAHADLHRRLLALSDIKENK